MEILELKKIITEIKSTRMDLKAGFNTAKERLK